MTDRETALQRLLDEREIQRVLIRYCRGLDRLDGELLRSVYFPDAYDDHGPTFRGNAYDYVADVVERLARYERTMHFVSNVLIELEGDVAWAESYLLAYHRTTDGSDRLFAGRYVDRCERRDGEWRIARRELVREFLRVDPVGELAAADVPSRARRSREDPAYGRE